MRQRLQSNLSTVRIASPCHADWDSMAGNHRQRFCSQCQRHVYNISEMTRREANRLLAKEEGGICARLYRRADGTVLTEVCPVGWSALKRRVSRVAGFVLSSGLTLYGSAFAQVLPVPIQSQAEQPKGSMFGVVTDTSGAPIPMVRVHLIEITQGTEFTGSTDAVGAYRLEGIPAGVYRRSIEAPGFAASRQDMFISGLIAIQQDAILAVGATGATIEVYPTAELLVPSDNKPTARKPRRTFFGRLRGR